MTSFVEFMEAIPGGCAPYPWQLRFAETSAESKPPGLVEIPTGCGKTKVVESLVWALAQQADRPPSERTVGVRTVWAIDRRILVDEVFAQTEILAKALEEAWNDEDIDNPLFDVAQRLQHLKYPHGTNPDVETGPPLLTSRWRGGLDESPPAQHPMQAEVITSTVGQIGSRLLFRGYGLGKRSRQLGAALAACGTTICLDEAHLAKPFAETVRGIADRQTAETEPIAPPVAIVRLSATLDTTETNREGDHISLSDKDRRVLAPRLSAPKYARLIDPEDETDRGQADAIFGALEEHLESGVKKIACIVNSVRMARMVFDQVDKKIKSADQILLVGPQRPADRSSILSHPVKTKNNSQSDSSPSRYEVLFQNALVETPLIVVATQTIEVGLDIDVDAMVTQSASASALTQRFGRLNRAGRDETVGRATIVRQRSFPLYEADEEPAWLWLQALPESADGIDVSVAALTEHPAPPSLLRSVAPPLKNDDLARLTETNPLPAVMADPDIDPFIRGVDSEPNADVDLFWRNDLEEADPSAHSYRNALLTLAPPRPSERLSLSIKATRNLLYNLTGAATARGANLRRQTLGGADLEGSPVDEAVFSLPSWDQDRIPFFVYRDREWVPGSVSSVAGAETVAISQIRPGDLLALPTSLGGTDAFGLAPENREGIDVADDMRPENVDPTAYPTPIRVTHGALMDVLKPAYDSPSSREAHVDKLLRTIARLGRQLTLAAPGSDEEQRLYDRVFKTLKEHPRIADFPKDGAQLKRVGSARTPDISLMEDEISAYDFLEDTSLEEDQSRSRRLVLFEGEESHQRTEKSWVLIPPSRDKEAFREAPSPPTVAEHCLAVSERAASYASSAGLCPRMVETIRLAGLAHDLGKADPRIQGFFHGGVAPPLGSPLAKSTFGTSDRSRDTAARRASGMPRGLRHEQSSVGIVLDAIESGSFQTDETDLLLHLVGAHHGEQHPLPRIPVGGQLPRRFLANANGIVGQASGDGNDGWQGGELLLRGQRLRERFGPWTLAYLESLLVLADRTVSKEGN